MASLQELIVIMGGLAATNAVLQLLGSDSSSGAISSIHDLPASVVLLFSVNIITIFRFAHGNYRHLAEEYNDHPGKAYTTHSIGRLNRSAQLGLDFVVITIEALLLTVMTVLFDNVAEFLALQAALLFLDTVWFFAVHGWEDRRTKSWAVNNLAFGALFVVLWVMVSAEDVDDRRVVEVLVIAACANVVNTAIDVWAQWDFYFPRPISGKRVFISAPMSRYMSHSEDNWGHPELRSLILHLAERLEGAGYSAFSPHEREEWGRRRFTPAEALRDDLRQLQHSDFVVAIFVEEPSPGVQIELGYAIANEIPVLQIVHPASQWPYLNRGFRKEISNSYDIAMPEDYDGDVTADRVIVALQGITTGSGREAIVEKLGPPPERAGPTGDNDDEPSAVTPGSETAGEMPSTVDLRSPGSNDRQRGTLFGRRIRR